MKRGPTSVNRTTSSAGRLLCAALALTFAAGCQTPGHRRHPRPNSPPTPVPAEARDAPGTAPSTPNVRLASHQQDAGSAAWIGATPPTPPEVGEVDAFVPAPSQGNESLAQLEVIALAANPALRRLQNEAAAEWSRTGYVGKLPDPTVSSMFFVPPMHFEPDRQIAEFQVMQMIPWLARLRAAEQRACLEAVAAENEYRAERLRVIGEIRAGWFKLYVLGKQIETAEQEQSQIESLITTANARVATGNAQPGDVLMATLELSSLQEQLISYRQQVQSTKAELNRLVGRDAHRPIGMPAEIEAQLPEWDHDLLRTVALQSQPELTAARLRTAATRWGIDVARLNRRPDLTLSAGWMVMDAPGAAMPDAGGDSWTLGVSTSLPLGRRKYDAMTSEATRRHDAAHASEEEIALRLDALLRGLWEQALAAQRTIALYETTILPQARQTFQADQQALVNNAVTFERVIDDYRRLLNLELGYHRALGELATTLARIRQTVGQDLSIND